MLALLAVRNALIAQGEVGSLEQLFARQRILMIHSGGDSRRLPMYAVTGKLFATLPMLSAGLRCGTVFDLLMDDLLSLPPRDGGEVLISAGDAVLGLKRAPIAFRGTGVIGVAQSASVERATRHGVFVRERRGRAVRAFVQKPSREELQRVGAIASDGTVLVDTGLVSCDPQAIAALLRGAGVSDSTAPRATNRAGSLIERVRANELPPIDLYREIMGALPSHATRAEYLASSAPALRAVLAPLFDAMRATPFHVEVAEVGEFLHIGSMREMLDAIVPPRAAIRKFGLRAQSTPSAVTRVTGDGAVVALDCSIDAVHAASGRVILDAVHARRLRVGGDNIFTAITIDALAARREFPRGICVWSLPHEARGVEQSIVLACGVDDDWKTPLDAGGTFMNQPFSEFARRTGVKTLAKSLVGDRSLWDQPLWSAGAALEPFAHVSWMWEGGAAPASWRKSTRYSPRYSMRQLLERVQPQALLARREETLAPLRAAHPLRTIESLTQPIARARMAAFLAQPRATAPLNSALRERAFREVGDAVLATHDLPRAAPRAVILHDQAVWTSMPVRVDLAGGWSDTPPICNEVGGSVVNVALMLRGQLPIQVVVKLVDEPVIRITSTDLGETRVIARSEDLALRSDPSRWSSLAENALVLTGAAPSNARESLPRWLARVGGGLSLTLFSAVPKGSGLGTSSILGAATIHCLDRVFGRERSPHELFAATSALEQMLSTRGGWQDQVGGVLGGFKLARSTPGAVQAPTTEQIAVPAALAHELSSRALLYFTGERRMAKNILEQVVWNWLRNERAATEAIEHLKRNALRMREALHSGDMDAVVAELTEYRRRKSQIDPGSCPPWLEDIGQRFKRELSAWCFAGAGGGGFTLLIAKSPRHAAALRESIMRERPHPRARVFDFEVDAVGLRCAVL